MENKIKIPLLSALLLVAVGAGYSLASSTLWSYQPLALFLSLWAMALLATAGHFTRLSTPWRNLGLSSLTGLLLWLGFPTPGLSPLLLVAWLPLLWLEQRIWDESKRPARKEVFRHAFNAALIWNILSTYWVANSALFAGVFAVVANSLLMTIPWLLHHSIRVSMPKLRYAPLVAFWLSFEMMHFHWDLAWPWLNLGNGFAAFHSWVQWYEYTGVLGGSLWIWLVNIFAFNCLWAYFHKKESPMPPSSNGVVRAGLFSPRRYTRLLNGDPFLRFAVFLSIAILLPLGSSLIRYYSYTEKGGAVEVVCVQPNFEPHYEQMGASNHRILSKSLELAKAELSPSTDYLIFPESTFYDFEEGSAGRHPVQQAFKAMVGKDYPDLKIIAGITGYKTWRGDSLSAKSTTRMSVREGDTLYYHVYNAAYYLDREGEGLYKKSKLVVGPEYLPFSSFLGFLEPVISAMGGTLKGFETQASRGLFRSTGGNAAPVICYEQDFGGFMGGYMRAGADFIAIITNDGWWGKTDGYRQHREFARLRAIESRRSVARAANTGSSCFINQRGDISQATAYGVNAAIKGSLRLNRELTYYNRAGDVIGKLAVFISIIFILNMIVRARMGKG